MYNPNELRGSLNYTLEIHVWNPKSWRWIGWKMIFLFHFWVIVEVQNLNFQRCIHIVYPSQKTHTSAETGPFQN